jgi:chromosome segregation ATPase
MDKEIVMDSKEKMYVNSLEVANDELQQENGELKKKVEYLAAEAAAANRKVIFHRECLSSLRKNLESIQGKLDQIMGEEASP